MYRKWLKIEFSAEKHAPIDLNRPFNAINQLHTLVLTHPYLHKPFSIFDISHRWLTGAVLVPIWSEKWAFWPIYVFARYWKYIFVEKNATGHQGGYILILISSFQYSRCQTGDVIGPFWYQFWLKTGFLAIIHICKALEVHFCGNKRYWLT